VIGAITVKPSALLVPLAFAAIMGSAGVLQHRRMGMRLWPAMWMAALVFPVAASAGEGAAPVAAGAPGVDKVSAVCQAGQTYITFRKGHAGTFLASP
jgi:hypothetical protein